MIWRDLCRSSESLTKQDSKVGGEASQEVISRGENRVFRRACFAPCFV